ncbi:hypothetical protein ES703_25876 [subsurface metagenome]
MRDQVSTFEKQGTSVRQLYHWFDLFNWLDCKNVMSISGGLR